jgi:3-oxoadipate enol-lactonase
MGDEWSDASYIQVPREQKDELRPFQAAHVESTVHVAGQHWKYSLSGRGDDALVLLPGYAPGTDALQTVSELGDRWRVLRPTYPCVSTIEELVDGVAGILDYEEIYQAHVLGLSLGGMVAQCFVRRYPDRTDRLILCDTVAPDRGMARRWKATLAVLSLLPERVVLSVPGRWMPYTTPGLPQRVSSGKPLALQSPKERILSEYRLLVDFAQNYEFAPDDLADWGGRVLIIEPDAADTVHVRARTALRKLYPQARAYTISSSSLLAVGGERQEYIAEVRAFLTEA